MPPEPAIPTTPLPCACGYDLRGLPPDGRCPECGRAIGDIVDRVRSAVAEWRRRVRAGGIIVELGWMLGAAAALLDPDGCGHRAAALIYVGVPGPRLRTLAYFGDAIGLGETAFCPSLAVMTAALIVVTAGLLWMTRVPPPLRTCHVAKWGVRLSAVAVALIAIHLAVFHLPPDLWSPLVLRFGQAEPFFWLDGDWTTEALATSVAELVSCGCVALFIARVGSASGRRTRGYWMATVFVTAGLVGFDIDGLRRGSVNSGSQWIAIYQSLGPPLSAARFFLLVQVGWMSFWSPDRWPGVTGGAGRPPIAYDPPVPIAIEV